MSVITNKWNDESGDSISIESPSFQGNQTVKISSPVQKGTSKRSMRFIGKCKKDSSKQVILIVEQEASTYTYDLTLNSDNTEIAAKGGTATITAVLKTYRNDNLVSTDNVTPVLSGSATGFSISGTKVTASNRTTTVGSRRSIVVTGKYSNTFDGQTVSSTITIYQEANEASYGALTGGSVLASDIPASGGTSSTSVTNMSQTISYTSGSTRAGTVTYLKTDEITVSSLETTVKERTKVGQVTVTYTGEGSVTANKTVDIYQAENKVTNSNYNPRITAYGTPTVSIGSGLTAAGGSATVSTSVTNTETYNALYSSGATGADQTRSVAGTITIAITTNGNNRFTLTDNKITHTSMGTNVVTDTVIITATNKGDTTKTATATKSIENKVTSTTYGDITVGTFTYPQVPASGSAVSPTVAYSQATTQNFTSGSTKAGSAVTSGGTLAYAKVDGTLTVATNGNVTAPSRGITVGNAQSVGNVKVTVTLNSKTGTKTVAVTQQANTVTSTTYSDITIGTYSYGVAPASGATINPSVSYSQVPTQHFTSGSTKALAAVTSGAILSYSKVSGDLITVNTTSGAVSGPNRTTIVGEARSIGVARVTVTLNSKTATKDVSVTQQANERSISSTTGGNIKYGLLKAGKITNGIIPARGGTARATAGIGKEPWSKTAVITNYSYTSGSTNSVETTPASTGENDIEPNIAFIEATAPSAGTWFQEQIVIKSQSVMWYMTDGGAISKKMYIYQEANTIVSYDYGSWNIAISANPTTIAASGGTSIITASCTRTKTPVYTSGSTGTATTESATPTLAISGAGFTLSKTTVTALKNNVAARTATVTASYSGATSKSVIITQSAGPDGIGYMQIQGNGVDHYIFQVGRTPNTNSNDVQTLSEEPTKVATKTKSESLLAKIKRIVTNLN